MSNPNCYECKWRRNTPGSAHSKCDHPNAGGNDGPMAELMAIFGSVGRVAPTIGTGAKRMEIKANRHGFVNGWFNWPYNFDPIWLEGCSGFEKAETP